MNITVIRIKSCGWTITDDKNYNVGETVEYSLENGKDAVFDTVVKSSLVEEIIIFVKEGYLSSNFANINAGCSELRKLIRQYLVTSLDQMIRLEDNIRKVMDKYQMVNETSGANNAVELNRVYSRIIYNKESGDIISTSVEETKYGNLDDATLNTLVSHPDKTFIKFIETTPDITTIIISGGTKPFNKRIAEFVQNLSRYNEEFKNKWLNDMTQLVIYEKSETLTTCLESILDDFKSIDNANQSIKHLKKLCEIIIKHDNHKGAAYNNICTIAKYVDAVLYMSDDDINSNALYKAINELYYRINGDDCNDNKQ